MTEELKRFEQWWDAEDDIPNNGPYTPDTPIQFAWAGWQAAKPLVVPDLLTTWDSETPEYRNGWNDCRQVMMEILRKESK